MTRCRVEHKDTFVHFNFKSVASRPKRARHPGGKKKDVRPFYDVPFAQRIRTRRHTHAHGGKSGGRAFFALLATSSGAGPRAHGERESRPHAGWDGGKTGKRRMKNTMEKRAKRGVGGDRVPPGVRHWVNRRTGRSFPSCLSLVRFSLASVDRSRRSGRDVPSLIPSAPFEILSPR